MIPKEKIEEVRSRVNIVQVISEYIPLRKRGATYVGLCPFHSEKTPSFSVSEEKKIFYCFGCNAAGNAITFIMKKEGLSFPDAVRSLAARCGVTIREEYRPAADLKESLYLINRTANEYFSMELGSPEGAPARSYLKKRGYGDESEALKRFALGFAPKRWDGLINYLKKKSISMDIAEKAGVVVKKESSKDYYDRFRNRLIFPITDIKGRIVGFGGRSIDNSEPKYLNSPETIIFKKGETLYGLSHARESIAKEGYSIVVEGYFDLLALHCHGFTNSVATMGTALTPEHIRALKGFNATVYSLFDSDTAGRNAALRALNLFLNEEVPSRAVILPNGKDPDEFLAKEGADAMKRAIEAAEPLMVFFLRELKKKLPPDTPENKKKFLDESISYLTRVKNVAERGYYAATLSTLLGIPVAMIYEALKSAGKERGAIERAAPLKETAHRALDLKELMILKVILKHPAEIERYGAEIEAALEAFGDGGLKDAGRSILAHYKRNKTLNIPELIEEFEDLKLKGVSAILFKDDDGFIEDHEKMLKDSLKKVLNRGKLKAATEELIKRLEDAGRQEIAGSVRERVLKGMPKKG